MKGLEDDNQAAYQEKSSQLDEILAAPQLEPITSDFYYHGFPPLAACNNPMCNLVEKEYNLTCEHHQEGTFR
jgi:hypothetical protein